MPRLLQLVHGFPPQEAAGTETYAARLAAGLRRRGWAVQTFAAHRLPGAPMYQQRESEGVCRLVQNAPYRGLATVESDQAVDRAIEEQIRRFRPDLIHVQHLQFLSTSFRTSVPLLWTLHDAWGWCASGGQLLRDGRPCEGPSDHCAPCASAWAREPAAVEGLLGVAGRLSPWIPPERLHRLWKALPARLRAQLPERSTPLSVRHLENRRHALRAFANRCAVLLSPSRYLADRAEQQGFPRPLVIPHGVDAPSLPDIDRKYLLFLGTLAPHKGALRVRAAWERAGRPFPLRIVGPPGPDLAYLSQLQAGDPRPEPAVSDVFPLLKGAKALVLGSIWPENAPLVVLEAQAMGCPVIAPALGGLPELVEEGGLYRSEAELEALLRSPERLIIQKPPSFSEHLQRILEVYEGLR